MAETIAAQRKFRAAQRSTKIRSRPPTKSQLRNLMMTYLKNIGGYKHSQLKEKSFEEIKGMYERQKKSVQDFVPIGSAKEEELIKKMNEKATDEDTSNKEKVLEEPDSTKVEVKQEGHEDNSDLEEEEQLKDFLMIVPDEEGITDYEVLDKRSDGSSRWIKTFSEMVTRFDRKYPLIKETLKRMLSLRLVAGTASEDAYTLVRFIQKKIDEYGSHNRGEKDL
ncbi:hypothetical protein Tco_0931037 [Tanacetum coccineum]